MRRVFVICLALIWVAGWSLVAAKPVNLVKIETQEQGEICLKKARQLLLKLGVKVNRNILLKVRPQEEVQVQYISTGGRSIVVGGYYQSHSPETIWIISGESRNHTISVIAHELSHAWQSTNCPLQDRTIKEGFAVWCQYKVLLFLGEKGEAKYLTLLKDPDYGGGLRLFLKVEEKGGIPAVIEFARKAKKVPK